jgi:hypothetical protein
MLTGLVRLPVKVRFSAVDVDVNYEIAQQLFCDRAQTTIISSIANDAPSLPLRYEIM